MTGLEGSFATGAFSRAAGDHHTSESHYHHLGAPGGNTSFALYQGAYIQGEDGAHHRPTNASFGANSAPNTGRRRAGSRRAGGSARSIPDDAAVGPGGQLQYSDGDAHSKDRSSRSTSPAEANINAVGIDAPTSSDDGLDTIEAVPPVFRWFAMIFICLITLGQYYIFDFPGAIGIGSEGTIQTRFHAHGKTYNQVMNQALYSIYSWPNTVLALAGGILIDRYLGIRRAAVLFGVLVCVGGWLFYLGVQSTQYPLMMVGRFVFGLGAESMSVAQSCFVARYFADGKGIALAFGITITVCRVASTANFFFSPRIASGAGVEFAVLIGAIVTCVSLVSAVILAAVDRVAEQREIVEVWARDESQRFQCLAIFKLPASSLLLGAICAFVYASIFPFIGIARDFFTTMYGLSGTAGSTQVSFYQLASAIGSPLLGGVVDRVGYSTAWLAGACFSFACIHLVFALTSAVPAPAMMVAMGIVYCVLVSSLWPSAPKTVDPARVGLAYGAMTSMQNTLLALTPLATGSILDHFEVPTATPAPSPSGAPSPTVLPNVTRLLGEAYWRTAAAATTSVAPHHTNESGSGGGSGGVMESSRSGYQYVELLFIGLALTSFVLTIVLWVVQARIGGVLHLGSAAARTRQKEITAEALEAAEADPLLL